MPYDQASFLAGVAAGRNMESWPAIEGSEIFRFTVQVTAGDVLSGNYKSPYMFFRGDIYWGDGTSSSFDNVSNLPYPPSPTRYRGRAFHAYSAEGLYQITLKGYLLEWGTGMGDYGGNEDQSLISVDTPFPHSMIGYTHPYQIHSTFSYARNLVSLPDGLYKNVKYTRIDYQFNMCNSLITLPPGLFDGCESVIETEHMFNYCFRIESIPPRLFAGMPNLISATGFFGSCPAIHYVPPGLLDPLQKLENASYMFNAAYSSGAPFPVEPAGLYFVPEHLFSNCPNITDFTGCFASSTAMEEFPPKLWELYPDAEGFACFRGCTNIPEFYKIPAEWK